MISTIFVIILVLVIDVIWLNYIAGPLYAQGVVRVQKRPFKVDYGAALLSYAFVLLGIFMIAIPLIAAKQKEHPNTNIYILSILWGGLVGLVSYGIYNATCKAIFVEYPWSIVIIDTLWGATLFATASCAFYFLSKHIERQHPIF